MANTAACRLLSSLILFHVEFKRSCGIVLHPTSLPGPHGIGDLGREAFHFAEYLAQATVSIWQVLPLGPTGYGDSPYQCLSAFAGNPLLIDLHQLGEEGLLDPEDLEAPEFPQDEVDFKAVAEFKMPLLEKAYHRFNGAERARSWDAFREFCRDHRGWLNDFALFGALKEAHDGVEWTRWPPELARREYQAINEWSGDFAEEIQMRRFWQFLFYRQWERLRSHCRKLGLSIMGDIPIFVAHDSAEVWAHPELFQLDESGRASVVAGVPPDYFSATGQLWGNPLYRWEVMARDGYRWWIERFRSTLSLVDIIRLDHFRGFEAYWEVAGDAETAVQGRWVKGPGAGLFQAVESELGELPIVAENLGWITPEVEGLRRQFGFPGMGILQFAFGSDPQANDFIPHNHSRDLVIYTGTHDNDTTVGWWLSSGEHDSTREAGEVEAERDYARRYLNTDAEEIHWDFIRAALGSVACIAVIPVQDILGLGSEARMNLPGSSDGNWKWRLQGNALGPDHGERLKELIWLYGRSPGESSRGSTPRALVSQD